MEGGTHSPRAMMKSVFFLSDSLKTFLPQNNQTVSQVLGPVVGYLQVNCLPGGDIFH